MTENGTKKKSFITQNLVPVTGRSLSTYDLRELVRHEPEVFLQKLQAGAEQGKLKITDIRDWKGLYGALAGERINIFMEDMAGYQRTISTSAFPILTGTLGIYAVQDAYNKYPAIGGKLVTDFEDAKKVTTMVAIHNQDSAKDEVKELETLPLVTSTEEKVEVRHRKNGRRIAISMEMISESEGFNITSQFNSLGDIAADWEEELTLERIMDYHGSKSSPAEPYVYRPDGVGTAIYSATANTPGTRAPSGTRINNNALADETDLDAFKTRLRSVKNARGKRINIPWSEVKFLIPDALENTMNKIAQSIYVPGVENEIATYGPQGKYRISSEQILSSPKVDDYSTSAWYGGAFQRQFRRKYKMRFVYLTLGQETQAYLTNHIAFQASLAWDIEVGALDYVYVFQNLSGTTAPADEA